jgi:hypothetical protein
MLTLDLSLTVTARRVTEGLFVLVDATPYDPDFFAMCDVAWSAIAEQYSMMVMGPNAKRLFAEKRERSICQGSSVTISASDSPNVQ